MVDPSAWTRWTKKYQDAPPHIYRALEWYLLLSEKHPSLGHPFWLSVVNRQAPKPSEKMIQTLAEVDELQERLGHYLELVESEKQRQKADVAPSLRDKNNFLLYFIGAALGGGIVGALVVLILK